MYFQATFNKRLVVRMSLALERRHLVILSMPVVMTCTCVMHDEFMSGMTYVIMSHDNREAGARWLLKLGPMSRSQ